MISTLQLIILSVIGIIFILKFKSILSVIQKHEKSFLVIPFFTLLFLGIILHVLEFKYIQGYITICGPILGACVAIYITYKNEDRTRIREIDRKITLLDQIKIILDVCLRAIKSEANNYYDFGKRMSGNTLDVPYLESTPFYFLEVYNNFDQTELYSAFLESNNIEKLLLKEVYLSISKNISNALYTKSMVEKQYPYFISRFNIYAEKWVMGLNDMNNLYRQVLIQPTPNPLFDSNFHKIVNTYNQNINSQNISRFNITDQFQYLITPLRTMLQTVIIPDIIFIELLQIIDNLEVSLQKMDEINNIMITHFNESYKHLADISAKLELELSKI